MVEAASAARSSFHVLLAASQRFRRVGATTVRWTPPAVVRVRTPFPSKANFVLARFPDSAQVFDALKTRGILVRNLSAMHPLMANTLRISVGIPAEMDALIKALKEIL